MEESEAVKRDRKRKFQDQDFVYSVDYEKTRRFKEEWKMQVNQDTLIGPIVLKDLLIE